MLDMPKLKKERAIGYNISQVMSEQNVAIDEFSKRIQISEMRLKAIITGSVGALEGELEKISAGLGVNETRLLETVPDEVLQDYNVHYMGTATCAKDMNQILDKVDIYVRLLNAQSAQ